MNAEIITIGDELLIGQTIDTNSVDIAKKLEQIGIRISRKTAISDNATDIKEMLNQTLQRVKIIIITGGLGPTKDDITKKTLAEHFNMGWRTDSSVITHLEKLFESRGRKLMQANLLQAELPSECITLHNAVGTAPGMWFDVNDAIVISIPGVPSEVQYLLENEIIPKLYSKLQLPKIEHKTLVTMLIPESILSKKLENFENELPDNLSLAYLPSYNSVKLRLSSRNSEISKDLLNQWFKKLQSYIEEHILCLEDLPPATYIAETLISNKISISVAESCTGGYIANQLVQVPGISSILEGCILSYSNRIKNEELKVSVETIANYGAVSAETALEMAKGVKQKFSSDIGIATTGIAGPDGGTPDKPIGLIFIAVVFNDKIMVEKFQLGGNRKQFMERACNCAMFMVHKILQNQE